MMEISERAAEFSRNERPKEYTAHISVRGVYRFNIEADNPEDALRQAEAEVQRIENEGYIEIDDIHDVTVDSVRKDQPMFRITRDGSPMQVSHLQDGDLPRGPDERGF
jgi:hypothetical protein